MQYYLVEYRFGSPSGAVMTDNIYAYGEWDAVARVQESWGADRVFIMSVKLRP